MSGDRALGMRGVPWRGAAEPPWLAAHPGARGTRARTHAPAATRVVPVSPPQEYQPIGGNPQFCELSAALAYGPGFPGLREGRVATVQTLSGTGALAVGGAFLARHYAVRWPRVAGWCTGLGAAGLGARGDGHDEGAWGPLRSLWERDRSPARPAPDVTSSPPRRVPAPSTCRRRPGATTTWCLLRRAWC